MSSRNIEYGSYATHLERRVIMPCWNSGYRRQRDFVFRTLTRPDPDGTHWALTVGHEMTLDTSHRWQRDEYMRHAEDKWIFRAFLDGTAFLHKHRLHYRLGSYSNATRKIMDVIDKHYFKDTEIQGDNRLECVIVYKRKPVSEYARSIALVQEQSLGEYLVRKYNMEVENATAV